MKSLNQGIKRFGIEVTPFTGVWVEIAWCLFQPFAHILVTPFTGVWVEIAMRRLFPLPVGVTPFTGVWVEIGSNAIMAPCYNCHTFHGCVG